MVLYWYYVIWKKYEDPQCVIVSIPQSRKLAIWIAPKYFYFQARISDS
jgi:hypothetical protein